MRFFVALYYYLVEVKKEALFFIVPNAKPAVSYSFCLFVCLNPSHPLSLLLLLLFSGLIASWVLLSQFTGFSVSVSSPLQEVVCDQGRSSENSSRQVHANVTFTAIKHSIREYR
jgi:hypothetical protein